ncbi:MAG: flagellar filament capping protein FliD [Lachnospiraceae bacterium]|nr:flagellar filament capping protein FliD [Lachnospiraceae bacterium]
MAIRISGMNSGLDTESIVSALVSSYATKKDKYVKAQTKLSWKADAYKAANTKVYDLYNSINSLRFTSAYSLKKTTVSDSTKASVTASSSAVNGTQTLKIKQLATAGYLTGGKLASGTTGSTKLSELTDAKGNSYSGDGTISVTADGKTTSISVSSSTTVDDFIQQLNDAGVKASYDSSNKRIFISSSDSGVENDFSLSGGDENGVKALSALGLYAASSSATSESEKYAALKDKTVDELKASIQAIADKYSEISSLTEENTALNAKISYAKAYQSAKDTESGIDSDVLTQLKSLMEESDPDSKYVAEDGTVYKNREEIKNDDGEVTGYKYYNESADEAGALIVDGTDSLPTVSEKITSLAKTAGLITETTDDEGNVTATDTSAFTAYKANLATIKAYEENDSNATTVSEVADLYTAGALGDNITTWQASYDANAATISSDQSYISTNAIYDVNSGDYDEDTDYDALASALYDKIQTAYNAIGGAYSDYINDTAVRVDGRDAEITLNGAEFTSSSNSFTINGLTINATATTGDDEISITTATDTDGIYDKVKDFIDQYNEVVNYLQTQYNATSAKGYEPLTEDEKSEMTDTQVEKWEQKIKDSLLRRDSTIGNILNVMSNSMSKTYSINGKNYSLGTFGISTLGYFNASANEQYSYHIDGDEDDTYTSAKTDKLKAAINEDPDAVIDLLKSVTDDLYKSLGNQMKSSSLRSAYTIYNDKEMASEYSDYTDTIKTWETRLADMEDRYYKQFTAMEKALAQMQSNSSALSGLLGS